MKRKNSCVSPSPPRTSAPSSKPDSAKLQRPLAFTPQLVAGVAIWLFAGVVALRSGATETKRLARLLSIVQPCTRQLNPPSRGLETKVRLALDPSALEFAPAWPEPRSSL